MAKYYVICDDDCRYESMTREQILAAIEQALEQGYVADPDAAVFSKIKEIGAGDTIQLWVGTEAEFNAISPAPNVGRAFVRVGENGVIYLCPDDKSADAFEDHIGSTYNPHNVTIEQTLTGRAVYPNHYTEEVKTCGRWIDGRPIYSKVVEVLNLSAGSTMSSHFASNVKAAWVDASASFFEHGSDVYPLMTGNELTVRLAGGWVYTKHNSSTIKDVIHAYIKICYTKSTDSETEGYSPDVWLDEEINTYVDNEILGGAW